MVLGVPVSVEEDRDGARNSRAPPISLTVAESPASSRTPAGQGGRSVSLEHKGEAVGPIAQSGLLCQLELKLCVEALRCRDFHGVPGGAGCLLSCIGEPQNGAEIVGGAQQVKALISAEVRIVKMTIGLGVRRDNGTTQQEHS